MMLQLCNRTSLNFIRQAINIRTVILEDHSATTHLHTRNHVNGIGCEKQGQRLQRIAKSLREIHSLSQIIAQQEGKGAIR
jgi:hypothetical protein